VTEDTLSTWTPSCAVVIPAWNAWETTRTCLEALKETLGPHDTVIVVDNGSRDETPHGLQSFPWVKVITLPENQGFAGGCNAGARAAEAEVIVFLNNDTIPFGAWLRDIRGAFRDSAVAAAGPRSNAVSGVQLVREVSYDSRDRSSIERFASNWMERLEGIYLPVKRLVGFCLAVRRQAFEDVGGFDEGFGIGGFEDDDLCLSLREHGWKLVVAQGSFVHHEGHVTFEANETPWFEHQCRNQARFFAKHPSYFKSLSSDERAQWFAQMVTMSPSFADGVAEVLYSQIGADPGLLALASVTGPHLQVARALVWSHRLRSSGQVGSCPLRRIVKDSERLLAERLQAGAVAISMFADTSVIGDFLEALQGSGTNSWTHDTEGLKSIFDAGLARLSDEDRRRIEQAFLESSQCLMGQEGFSALKIAFDLGLLVDHSRA